MNRAQLEHLIRAAGMIADDDEIVVIGSQAILGAYPDAPRTLRASMKADVYPRHKPELADVIDGTLGELSVFHETYGYYAQGVGPDTATLPEGWDDRLVAVRNENTRGVTGLCLDAHDLVISKLVAGREKDLAFAGEAVRHHLVRVEVLRERLGVTSIDPAMQAAVAARIDALSGD